MHISPDETLDILEQLRLEFEELRTSGHHDDKERMKEIPREVCETVRATDTLSLDDIHEVLAVADEVLNEVVDTIYNSHSWDFRDFLPSFADTGDEGDAPVMKDTEAGELHFMGKYHTFYYKIQLRAAHVVCFIKPGPSPEWPVGFLYARLEMTRASLCAPSMFASRNCALIIMY